MHKMRITITFQSFCSNIFKHIEIEETVYLYFVFLVQTSHDIYI